MQTVGIDIGTTTVVTALIDMLTGRKDCKEEQTDAG